MDHAPPPPCPLLPLAPPTNPSPCPPPLPPVPQPSLPPPTLGHRILQCLVAVLDIVVADVPREGRQGRLAVAGGPAVVGAQHEVAEGGEEGIGGVPPTQNSGVWPTVGGDDGGQRA